MKRTGVLLIAVALLAAGCAPARRMTFKDPLNAAEHFQLGAAYERQGELDAARREYRAATRKDDKDVAAFIALGNVAYASGDFREARHAFTRALKLSDGGAAASNNLAMLYASRGKRLRRAEKLASRAASDERFRPYALDTLATIYARQGRTEEARAALAEARAAAPAGDPAFLAHLEQTAKSIEGPVR